MPLRPRLAVLAALSLLAACGRDAPPGAAARGPAVVDRSSPEVVYARAHAALAAGDLAGLRPYLTETGALRLTRDLQAWRALLVDPSTGPRAASRLRLGDDPGARADAERALKQGDDAALLRLWVAADAREGAPAAGPAARSADATRAEMEVSARDGERRLIRFARGADGWRIDHLPL